MGTQFQALGRIRLLRDGAEAAISGKLARTFLAMLLSRPNEPVPVHVLAEALWPGEPDAGAQRKLQLHAHKLRRLLDEPDRLAFEHGGYRLRVDPGDVDVQVFESLADQAVESAGVDRTRCAESARRALELWRGTPYGGLDVPELVAEERRLSERRLAVLELLYESEVARGRAGAVVSELADLARRHPLRERLIALLMTALYRSGRQAEALEVYRNARDTLVDELGIEPGPELRELERRVLADDVPSGDADVRPEHQQTPAPADRPHVPRQLPVDIAGFIGRAGDVEQLDRLVEAGIDNGGTIIAVHGPAGAGKTTVAVHCAHRHVDRFPDGQLFLNLRGHGPSEPLDTATALDALLRGLGWTGALPEHQHQRSELFRDQMADRRMLVVLDNARDTDHVRPLLPGGRNVVVVTSRSQLRGLAARDGADRVPVEHMTAEDAVELLHARLQAHPDVQTADGLVAIRELAELCGNLPVALAVAAERAGRYHRLALRDVVADLRREHNVLNTLTAWEDDPTTSVRAVLSWSYEALADDAARLYRLLGLHPHPTYSTVAAAALCGVGVAAAGRLLGRLVDTHLVSEPRPGEYEMHDLVRAHAAELVHATIADAERTAAVDRMRSAYVHSVDNARTAVLGTSLVTVPLPDVLPGVEPEKFSGSDAAARWFNDNRARLTAIVTDTARSGDHVTSYQLASLMGMLLDPAVHPLEAMQLCDLATSSAEAVHDHAAEAICTWQRGVVHWSCGRPREALECAGRAEQQFRAVGNERGQLAALMSRGLGQGHLGQFDSAIESLEEAVALAVELAAPRAMIQNNLAMTYLAAGRRQQACAMAQEAVRSALDERSARLVAVCTDSLAEVYLAMGEPGRARDLYLDALARYQHSGVTAETPDTWKSLGEAQLALGDTSAARTSWEHALRLLDDHGWADSHRVTRSELRELIASLDRPAMTSASHDIRP